jgi:hypothetical protein
VPVAQHLVDDDVRLLVALERLLVPDAVDDVEVDRELLAGFDHVLGALLLLVRRRVDDSDALALDRRDEVVRGEVDPGREHLGVVRDELQRRERAHDACIGLQAVHELVLRVLPDVGAQEVEERLAACGPEDRELDALRDEREPEVEVEDVGLREELRERAPLDELLAQEAFPGTLQVPVRLVWTERLRVEDDEPRVDAAFAQRLHVRPPDPGQVDRAVRDSEAHRPGSIVS